jgi:hypothetical protein
VTRIRTVKKKGVWVGPTVETVYVVTSLTPEKASPEWLLRYNSRHWAIEIMRRDKGVLLGEDGYTNRKDNAPRCVAAVLSLASPGRGGFAGPRPSPWSGFRATDALHCLCSDEVYRIALIPDLISLTLCRAKR